MSSHFSASHYRAASQPGQGGIRADYRPTLADRIEQDPIPASQRAWMSTRQSIETVRTAAAAKAEPATPADANGVHGFAR